jgi:hypothetical protein
VIYLLDTSALVRLLRYRKLLTALRAGEDEATLPRLSEPLEVPPD